MNLRYFARNICTSVVPQARYLSTLPSSDCVNKALDKKAKLLHSPVMVKKVIELLNPQPSQNILDMTFGAGGHTKEILRKCPEVNLFALDRDPLAYQLAKNLSEENARVKPLLGRFSEVRRLLKGLYGITSVHGAILDAGVSSMQFDDAQRGFSLSKDGPIDMRMDQDRDSNQPSAYDVINNMSETNLVRIINKYGEEGHAKPIARAIVDHRYAYGPIKTTHMLADVVASSFPGEAYRFDKLNRPTHVATKTFQAIRIFVNNELNELSAAMEAVYNLLVPGGVFVVLTFHSLEDRIIKRHFHGIALDEPPNMNLRSMRNSNKLVEKEVLENYLEKKWNVVLRKITLPTDEEVEANPRSRSAKLRFAYKPLTD